MFFSWGGELAAVTLPTMQPLKEMDRYRKTGEHEFRRIRKDGTLGESVTFDVAPDGRAKSVRVHSNAWMRIE